MPLALFDFHHSQLAQAWIYLFEKHLGIPVHRPEGREWYDRGYYYHPIEAEALGNLCKGPDIETELSAQVPHEFSWQKSDAGLSYFDQDNLKFRWLPFDRVNEVDYLICTTDRNEQRFANLKRNVCPNAKVIRYIGNRTEFTDPNNWDIGLMATQVYYDQFKDSKPCVLFHPEFDLELYKYSDPMAAIWPLQMGDTCGSRAVLRNFLNFTWHHRERGSPWETWNRYHGYCNEFGYIAICHGLGTPPPDVHVEMDVILDTCFDRMGRPELKDRSKWPDLRWNQGEPGSHKQIAELMRLSNMAVHIKRGSEGYGFIIHCLAAMGRPPIIEQTAYEKLSAYKFLQHRETCLFVTGHDPTDKGNLRWAMEPENNLRMAQTLHRRFCENVNFESEAVAIKKLL